MIRSLHPRRAPRRRRPLAVIAVTAAAASAVAVTACGSYQGGRAGLYGLGQPGAPAAGASAASGGALTLRHTALGPILTTAEGLTVYAFEADKGSTSACTGACAAAWPPVTTSGGPIVAGGGASTSLVAQTTRAGGVHQLTYAGHPLYTFAGDTGPGTTNGQGSEEFGARWDVLTAAGHEVTGG